MNTVDYIVLGILAVSMGIGWFRGFLKTILKPVCWVLCLYLGYAYYMKTQSVIVALGIGIIGPFVIKFLLTAVINIIRKAGKKDGEKEGMSLLSRVLGLCVAGGWMLILIGMAYFMVGIVPFKIPGFEPFRQSIVDSKSYTLFRETVGKSVPRLAKAQEAPPLDFSNPDAVQQLDIEGLQNSTEYKQLMERPQVRALFEDQAFQEKVRNGEVLGLMEDKRIKEILQDPEVMKEFFSFYNRLIQMVPAGATVDPMMNSSDLNQ